MINSGEIKITFPNFGSEVDIFKEYASSLTDNRISYYDKLPREEFIKFLVQHDLYLSNSETDSSPVSLIEAMGLGLIPICADIPGIKEWLKEENGYIYQSDDADDLVSIINSLQSKKDIINNMADKNIKMVVNYGIYEENISALINCFRQVTKK